MRGAYGAGFVGALVELVGYGGIAAVFGTSAGAANAAALVAKKREVLKEIWTHSLHVGTFIRPLRFKWITDTHFLMQLIAREGVINATIASSPTRLVVAVTNYRTGEPHFFTNRDDILRAVHASLSMPVLCRTPIEVQGDTYLDGGIATTTGSLIKKAFAEGADKVIALDLSIHLQWVNRVGLRWYARKKTKGLHRAIERMLTEPYPEPIPPDPRVYLIRPHHLVVSRLTRAPYSLIRAYELGREETLEDERLKSFLGL